MIEKYIFPGQRIELKPIRRVKQEDEGLKESKTFASKVFDILDDDRLEITMPMEQTKLILLSVDAEFEMIFYTDNGLYACSARVSDRYKSNNVYLLSMEMTSNLRKYQRREYYRFYCSLELDTRELAQQEIDAAMSRNRYLVPGLPLKRGIIVDISGGGLRFISDYRYEKDSLIYCKYVLYSKGKDKTYEIVGKVLSVAPVNNRPGEFEHRIQYQNLDNDIREEIIQYIFEEERKNRRREKGI